jgi:hypothetical protein
MAAVLPAPDGIVASVTIAIRSETVDDRDAVYRVHAAAFGRPAEADLVDRLRPAARPQVSLVAIEDLVHLVKAVKAVADAMGRPRWLLAILFGTARGPSRPFEEMRRVYQERLARGGRAGGDDVDLRVARPPRPVLPTRRRPVTTTSSARSEPYRVSRASSSRSRSTNISTLQGSKTVVHD